MQTQGLMDSFLEMLLNELAWRLFQGEFQSLSHADSRQRIHRCFSSCYSQFQDIELGVEHPDTVTHIGKGDISLSVIQIVLSHCISKISFYHNYSISAQVAEFQSCTQTQSVYRQQNFSLLQIVIRQLNFSLCHKYAYILQVAEFQFLSQIISVQVAELGFLSQIFRECIGSRIEVFVTNTYTVYRQKTFFGHKYSDSVQVAELQFRSQI